MDKSLFVECLRPAFSRWRDGEIPGAVLDEYYADLGGFTEAQVTKAVAAHLARAKGFPRVGELRKAITGEEEAPRRRRASYADDPEFHRHHRCTERLFERLVGVPNGAEPDGTFRYRIADVARKAAEEYERLCEERGQRSAMSCAYAQIWLETVDRFS